MKGAPAPSSADAVPIFHNNQLPLNRVAAGKTMFAKGDGSRFVTSGASARALIKLMASPPGITTLDLWPNLAGELDTTTRFGSVLFDLRHRFGLNIETTYEPNVSRPGLHGRFRLLDRLTVVGSG